MEIIQSSERLASRQSRVITCGYCRGVGHNRRTCVQLVNDRNNALENNLELNAIDLTDSFANIDKPMTISELECSECIECNDKSSKLDECEDEECPVCMCSIGKNNYMVPKCGHKICCDCLFTNVKQNKTTGNLCPLCREESVPKDALTIKHISRISRNSRNPPLNAGTIMSATTRAIDFLQYQSRPTNPDEITVGQRGYHYSTLLNTIRNLNVDQNTIENLEILVDNASIIDFGYEIMHELMELTPPETNYNGWQDEIYRMELTPLENQENIDPITPVDLRSEDLERET
jgi:hypothetical protein